MDSLPGMVFLFAALSPLFSPLSDRLSGALEERKRRKTHDAATNASGGQ